jgi:AcrR family transcriptional regulator
VKDKRERILDAAYRLFKKQGYQGTSIQQIADECDIAKGSIYSYYSSKQHLLIALLSRIDNSIQDQVLQARNIPGLSKKERFLLEIQVVLKSTAEQRVFQAALSHGTLEINQELEQYNSSVQYRWMELQTQSLLNYFGLDCQPWLGDLALCLNSMVDAYCYLLITTQASISHTNVSEMILLAAEGMVDRLREVKPEPAAQLEDILSWLGMKEIETEDMNILSLFNRLSRELRNALDSYPKSEQAYALTLLDTLEEIISQESWNPKHNDSTENHMIRALLRALQDFPEIHSLCDLLLSQLSGVLDS